MLASCLACLALGAVAGDFTLSSPDIKAGGRLTSAQVFDGFGCTGKNISPALKWQGAPAGTRSYALTVYDPDAPTGSGWWHWVALNIPASVQSLAEGAGTVSGTGLPEGVVQVRTDFGQPGFGGACPPVGDKPHRYIFTIHALKVPKIDLPPNATAALAGYMIHANELGQAGFTAYYGR
ncbi:MAG: YbhB/YbcL family Raf kinase inhibitor-like protein [Betaproteobacteria bacterium]|nr:YbhB/YbcL family Raf kinase inhibitor-like protein [Betaproteobacteria bacterium]